jgi:two-component system, OmpR family, sensor kinase
MSEAGKEAGKEPGRPPGEPGRRPTPFQRWLGRRTLRGRLIAGLLALLAVACGAIGLVTYVGLQHGLMSQLDQQLGAASTRYGTCLEAGAPDTDHGNGGNGQSQNAQPAKDSDHDNDNIPGAPQACGDQQGGQTFSAALDGDKVFYPTVANGRCSLNQADLTALKTLKGTTQPKTVSFSSLGPYQLMASPAKDGTTVITGLPLGPAQNILRDVELTEAIVFGATLILTGLLGTGFVRLSLRPLRRVAATAARVTELPLASGEVTLAERVPDANPRTEVGQVGMAFNRMLGHVESALGRRAASEARLRRFAADASHELRTPLAAIRGYAELALRHPGPVPADIEHALQRVESESERMSVLVDELLLLAQLDAGRPLAQEPVDLTRLAIDATSDARVAASNHRWLLELPDEPVMVRGDEHRLHQVLANLMSNAARHTPKDTVVTVALAVGEAPGTVELSVTDDGPGVPPELQPTLFERFVRGDSSRARGSGGAASTGLGLAIVDAVTAAHGGRVRLESRPGRTRFVITLPQLDDLTRRSSAPRSPAPLSAAPRSPTPRSAGS